MKHSLVEGIGLALVVALTLWWAAFAGAETAPSGGEILQVSGVRGGLVVQLGCGDGRQLAELYANERYLVQGLEISVEAISTARGNLKSKGLYGKVTVAQWDGETLPYLDHLVNLIVFSEGYGTRISKEEINRVLVPEGVALFEGGGSIPGTAVNIGGSSWTLVRKPRPDNIDEWTHELHDASGNAVAEDTAISHPRSMQWIAHPSWAKNHDVMPDVSAMVTSSGRLFYISEESASSVNPEAMPDKWFLVARDAFNGIELWRLSIDEWGWKSWSGTSLGRNNQPTHIASRLVCKGDRVYVTLGFNAPVSELDAATGEVLRVFEGTEYTDEILQDGNVLVLSVNQRKQGPAELNAADRERRRGDSAEGAVNASEPVPKSIMVIDLDSGKAKWKSGD
jgi:SAM-dependent methyltransferase